ncbi:MAG: 3-dehydroquinate synthase, partial [Candidatus Nealsonbacteria bacterium]
IACLGGGTIGDLGGFAASIYKRGIPYIQIPTTLLAQIDSSIGGKTAIDLNIAKNILGSFYQPKAVFIDPIFLKTLPLPEIKQGLAEIIKYGVIKNKDFFFFLKKNYKKILKLDKACILKIINICAGMKAQIVSQDEKEKKGLRTILNFGHTLAHALESSLRYKKLSHGEAVSLGMLYAAQLSYHLGKCNKKCLEEILQMIKLFGLPYRISFDPLSLYKSLCYDKKFISGKIRMVLVKEIGRVKVVENINPNSVKKAFNGLIS